MRSLTRLLRHSHPRAHHVALDVARRSHPALAGIESAEGHDVLRSALALACVAYRGTTDPALNRRAASLAARCAEELVPLAELEQACQVAATALVAEVWHRCPPGLTGEARRHTARIVVAHRRVWRALLAGYRGHTWIEMTAPADYLAAGTSLSRGELPAGTDDTEGGYLVAVTRVRAEVPATRLVAEVEAARGDRPVLVRVAPRSRDVVLMLPLLSRSRADRRRGERVLDELVGVLAGLLLDPVAGCAHARFVREIPSASRAAATMLVLPSGYTADRLLRTGDLLLDNAYDAVPELGGRIGALLAPLEGEPDLLRTLVVFYDFDLDRRDTAAALHVHRATLAQRLRRISELTGVNPTTVSGIKVFSAAIALRGG